jgi:hypothetical protein
MRWNADAVAAGALHISERRDALVAAILRTACGIAWLHYMKVKITI